MRSSGKLLLNFLLLLLFWVVVFDFQRLVFAVHNWDKISEGGFGEFLLTFIYSLRLDLATAGFLTILPMFFVTGKVFSNRKFWRIGFRTVLILELILCALIHAGEINAYPEWNHKLTTRVFMHLTNPDEVFRTADWGMTIWFIVYFILEFTFGYKLQKWIFKPTQKQGVKTQRIPLLIGSLLVLPLVLVSCIVLGRGGFQQIPINSDAAYFSRHYAINDLSVNSLYFFAKSFMLYNRAEIDQYIPDLEEDEIKKILPDFYNYQQEHDIRILENQRPNLVFVILESWQAGVTSSLSGTETGTKNFDELAKDGLLFTQLYATGGTSEIGNSSIFSGYPTLPEISISMQPDKHRKLPSLNQDLKKEGYTSGYIFSGDLKYGNIGGYFTDHGFDKVEDENDFPKGLPRGKLNYYDEDLYKLLIQRMDELKEPFMQCGFTGSTHSPYDYPKKKNLWTWTGAEADFMNSIIYADQCIEDFLTEAKKHSWYNNTLFIFVADHGHASPIVTNPNEQEYFHVPLLFYGEPLKKEFRGKRIDKMGSQADIAKTLLVQMGLSNDQYIWSKDLLNPEAPEFALHTVNRGYGWMTPEGNFTYQMEMGRLLQNTYTEKLLKVERERCGAFMSALFQEYKKL